jgi:thiamine biosynthesis lipoprotein
MGFPLKSVHSGFSHQITRLGTDYHIAFQAMATPCEVRIETHDAGLAREVGEVVEGEARRVEQKFSRYRADSVVGKINAGAHLGLVLDEETAALITCAAGAYETSGGLFDITSGVLRRAWHFDGSAHVPDPARIRSLLQFVGWEKVTWNPPELKFPAGMEIDLGGLAKEYAVDRALAKVAASTSAPALVNFGGDLCVSGPRSDQIAWNVAIESVETMGKMAGMVQLMRGAIATSGDARRYIEKDGRRYGHILNPRNGWPVKDAPRSVTVAAASCTEAGLAATLAVLQGAGAEKYLKREGIRSWCIR